MESTSRPSAADGSSPTSMAAKKASCRTIFLQSSSLSLASLLTGSSLTHSLKSSRASLGRKIAVFAKPRR